MLIILAIVFGIGVYAGKKMATKIGAPANQDNTYQAGWNAAKQRLAQKGIGITPGDVKTLGGTADSVNGNTLILKDVSTSDPLSDPSLDTRTVHVTADTKIYQLVPKDPAQFQQELQASNKAMQAQPAGKNNTVMQPVGPSPQSFEQKEISLSDIKAGQRIVVMSNDPIGDKKEFTATTISLTVQIASPVPMPLPVK
jgi:hypothetical protein